MNTETQLNMRINLAEMQALTTEKKQLKTALNFSLVKDRDVTDSKSDRIWHFFPKSIGYLKSDRIGLEIFVSVHLYNYFHK